MTTIYLTSTPPVNRELRQSCRFSTIVSKAYTIPTYLFTLLVLIMDLCIKALDENLCSLSLPVPVKYAYLKLCTVHPLFCEFYIFKPELSDEWGVAPKTVERYFSRFEKHKLFARDHKKSKVVGKSGPALYGKLTPPTSILLTPTLPSVSSNKAKEVLVRAMPKYNVDYEILKYLCSKQEGYKKQLEDTGEDKKDLQALLACLAVMISIFENLLTKEPNLQKGNQ